jgi:PTS system glucose-specific IIA component
VTLVVVLAPIGGNALPLRSVPDEVFAAELVGPGVAIDPVRSGRLVAGSPVSGKVVKLHPHAFIVQVPNGAGVLVHLGIDTVQLAGEGFELLVPEGSDVVAGAGVVAWYPDVVEATGRSAVCPVIALDAAIEALSNVRETGEVAPGDPLFSWAR